MQVGVRADLLLEFRDGEQLGDQLRDLAEAQLFAHNGGRPCLASAWQNEAVSQVVEHPRRAILQGKQERSVVWAEEGEGRGRAGAPA